MKFNENLKYLRKEANLTQEQFAEKLNVSRQAVTKWESGQSYPDIQNLKEMADMFNVTMDALVGDIGSKKESVINKKINDVGYFIFVDSFLFFFSTFFSGAASFFSKSAFFSETFSSFLFLEGSLESLPGTSRTRKSVSPSIK